VRQQGMKLEQVATYELTELGRDSGKARLKLEQFAPRGKIAPAGLPAGVEAEIISLSSHGDGTVAFELSHGTPQGKLRSKAKIKIATTQAGRTEQTEMDLDVRVRFEKAER